MPPTPSERSSDERGWGSRQEIQGASGGDCSDSSPPSKFLNVPYLVYVLTLRPCLRSCFLGVTITLRELPRRERAVPGSQTEEICAQDSADPSAFWGKPLILGCDFPCKGGSDISRHEQSPVRIHSPRSLHCSFL